jgi:hypothetical protein
MSDELIRAAASTEPLGCSWYRTGSGSDRVKHSTFGTTRKSSAPMLRRFQREHLSTHAVSVGPRRYRSGFCTERFIRSGATQQTGMKPFGCGALESCLMKLQTQPLGCYFLRTEKDLAKGSLRELSIAQYLHLGVGGLRRCSFHQSKEKALRSVIRSSKVFEAMISFALRARRRGEFSHLTSTIKREQVDGDALLVSYIEKYQSRYGEQWQQHTVELLTEVNQVCDEDLERKGFTQQHLYAAVLERIAPLLPYYRQVPELRDEVRLLEEGVGNQQVAAL